MQNLLIGEPGACTLRLTVWDLGGGHTATEDVHFVAGSPAEVGQGEGMQKPWLVGSAIPNPASGLVGLELAPAEKGLVDVRIVGVDGRVIRTWTEEGPRVEWDCRDSNGRRVPAGRYYVAVRKNGHCASRAVTVIE